MKVLPIFLLFTLFMVRVYSQSKLPLRADTVTVEKIGGVANFQVKDVTKDSLGVVYNIGNGVYRNKRLKKINDSTFNVGNDTISLRGNDLITASNGLTRTGNDISFGGSYSGIRTLTGSAGGDRIVINAPSTINEAAFRVNATANFSYAVRIENTAGYGLFVNSTNRTGILASGGASGINASSTTGIGLQALTLDTLGIPIYINSTRQNTGSEGRAYTDLRFFKNTAPPSGAATAGSGSITDWQFPVYNTAGAFVGFRTTNEHRVTMTDITGANQTSEILWNGLRDSSLVPFFAINGGVARLPQYVSTFQQTVDTGFNSLVVNASGVIYKRAGGGGGGSAPTWQETLSATNGRILTTDNTIVQDGHSFDWHSTTDGFGHFHHHSGFADGFYNIVSIASDGATDSIAFKITAEDGTIEIGHYTATGFGRVYAQSNQIGQQYSTATALTNLFTQDGTATILVSGNGGVSRSHRIDTYKDSIVIQADTNGALNRKLHLRIRGMGVSGVSTDSLLVKNGANGEIFTRGLPQSFAQTATATVSATGTETTLISTGTGSLVIPASDWTIGKTYECKIHGYLDTDGANPAGFNFRLKLGGTTIATTGNMLQGAGVSDRTFEAVITFTTRTVSSTGTIFTMGHFITDNDGINKFDNGTATSTLDMTGSLTLDLTVQMSDGSAGNNANVPVLTFRAIN